jgi:hypothetical protein
LRERDPLTREESGDAGRREDDREAPRSDLDPGVEVDDGAVAEDEHRGAGAGRGASQGRDEGRRGGEVNETSYHDRILRLWGAVIGFPTK